MCVHKRTLYAGCMCSDWGVKVLDCKVEKDFLAGELPISCVRLWSHGLYTRKVDAVCPDCLVRKELVDKTLKDVKAVLRSLRENVERRLVAPTTTEKITEKADEPSGEKEVVALFDSEAENLDGETKCDSESTSSSAGTESEDSSSTIGIPQWRTRHHSTVTAPAPTPMSRPLTRESEAVYMYVPT